MINQNLLLTGDDGYNLTNSLRFRNSASAYLSRTPSSSGDTQKFTYSAWVKLGQLSMSGGNYLFSAVTSATTDAIRFTSGNTLQFFLGGAGTAQLVSTAVYRDPSAWYHVVVAVDTTQATASNRVRMYVNGVEITSFSTANYPSQNTNCAAFNVSGKLHTIANDAQLANYGDEYLTEVNFVNAQQLTPSSFGETSATTGVWIPKKFSGTYGTNGFYLKFTDTTSTSTLGTDFSGNSNTWTVNNISLTAGTTYDSMTDVPTLTSATAANYSVLNPLNPSGGTYSDGNLKWVSATTDGRFALSTFDITTSGKWYCEVTIGAKSGTYWTVGAFGSPITFNPRMQYRSDGATQVNGSAGSTFASFTTGDIIGMAFDASTNQITFYKNNTSQGTLTASTTGVSYYFGCGSDSSGSTSTYTINFGQQPFAYTPPTGFVALNTFNLPTPTIGATASTTANKYFDATLYTGNGSTQTITNAASFKPDLVWGKARSAATSNEFYDSIRGGSQSLLSNTTGAENNWSPYGVTAFNSNGFSVNDITSSGYGINETGVTYVGWQWRASNATAVTNTAGSITSTVSANTTAGFSIVTYTGTGSNATVGHGLGVAPSMYIVKRRNAGGDNWAVYHVSTGNTQFLRLDTTNAAQTFNLWQNTTPTSSVFYLTSDVGVNGSGSTYVAYCFAPVAGYSAMGSYTGNGSTDGPFVYTGFRPKYWLIKRTDSADYWVTDNSVTSPYNPATKYLLPSTSDAEGDTGSNTAGQLMDVLSNGFKLRNTNSGRNASGGTYIYMAFAENPFKYANAR
jgi:hypothetical protein